MGHCAFGPYMSCNPLAGTISQYHIIHATSSLRMFEATMLVLLLTIWAHVSVRVCASIDRLSVHETIDL